MTKWDVLSDAIKIGLPSLITAVTAIRIARVTRSHELAKERLRRRQDALEKVSDDFQAACFRLSQLAINYSAYRESQIEPAAGRIALDDLWKSGDAINESTKDIYLIAGRIKLLRLKKCEKDFDEFLKQTIAFRKMLKLPPQPMATDQMVRGKLNELKALQGVVEDSLAEAFETF
jgi:hypothetical protein